MKGPAMLYSQVRTEQLKTAIDQALMNGLEHDVVRESRGWTTLKFTTHFGKLRFEELSRQVGVCIRGEGHSAPLTDALDAVCEGADPEHVMSLLEAGFTRGMVNAYARGPFKYVCASEQCGITIPSYQGRYPQSCPACGSNLMTADQWSKRNESRRRSRRVSESATADDMARNSTDLALSKIVFKKVTAARDIWDAARKELARRGITIEQAEKLLHEAIVRGRGIIEDAYDYGPRRLISATESVSPEDLAELKQHAQRYGGTFKYSNPTRTLFKFRRPQDADDFAKDVEKIFKLTAQKDFSGNMVSVW